MLGILARLAAEAMSGCGDLHSQHCIVGKPDEEETATGRKPDRCCATGFCQVKQSDQIGRSHLPEFRPDAEYDFAVVKPVRVKQAA